MLPMSLTALALSLVAASTATITFPSVASRLYTPPAAAPAVFALSATLGDHMTLQRDVPATVWGFAASGTSVKTTFAGNSYTASAGSDGIWRQALPATPANKVGQTISFAASTGETAALDDVVFGDVYICSGQSNMQFSIPATTNSSAEAAAADNYPHIRLFTVGQGTSSKTPLNDLRTIEQHWAVANSSSVSGGGGFGYFSSVCWFFGRQIADALNNEVPMGLVSNNWGGTPVEHWADEPAFARCNRTDTDSTLYNAMIYPYVVGPMSLSGFTWYQGEANTKDASSADAYACLFPSMIQSWRANFGLPADAYFGFVQLSTWAVPGDAIPLMRQAQMAAVTLQGAGYALNADHGAGSNVHPPQKQNCGARLGNSALVLKYKQSLTWKSPSFASQVLGSSSAAVALNDVTAAGLALRPSANAGTINCTSTAGLCAWASLQFDDAAGTWANATVAVSSDGQGLVLSAQPPAGATKVVASSYAWGAVPFMTAYLAEPGTDLPVQAWRM